MKNTIRKFAAVSLVAALLAGCSSSASASTKASSSSSSSSDSSSSAEEDSNYLTETDFNGNDKTNPHGYDIHPVEAASVPLSLDDAAIGVVNGNYALEANLPSTHPAIEIETFDEQTTIARTNFIVVNEDQLDSEKTKALVAAVTSDKVKSYIEDTYKGSVIPSFIDKDGNAVQPTDVPSPTGDDTTITVGATEVPHAQILNDVVKGVLEDAGWTLNVVTYSDYVQPNTNLNDGDLDANYYQTLGYMENTNSDAGYHLAAAVGVHIEPMGIYSTDDSIKSLDDVKDGSTIVLPNDADNEDRALRLLIAKGLLVDPSEAK